MNKWVTDHRKAITGAVLGAAAAMLAGLTAGASWQALIVAGVAGALGVGVPVNQVRNGEKPAAGA